VRSLGVSLHVYKNGEKWEWTSLLEVEKKTLLKKLPELFEKFLPSAKVAKTRQLWIVLKRRMMICGCISTKK